MPADGPAEATPQDWDGDWAQACMRILEAGSDGPDRVFALLAGATRRLTGAAGALVVGWQAAGPRHLVVSGATLDLPARRLATGVTRQSDGWVASVPVQGETDLLVWWRTGGAADTSDATGQPSADRIEELRLLATLAATACRRAGAALSSLYAVARRLLASRDREVMLLGLATATADVLRSEIAGVFLTTADGEHVQAQAVVGNRSMQTARLRLAKGESMVGHVLATGAVYRVDDWTTDPVTSAGLLPVASEEGTQACIGAPMRVDGSIVGVLAAWRRRRSVYTDDDVELIGTLADLAALSVQRVLAEERLVAVSEQLRQANRALSERFEETNQTLQTHRRLMRVVADGADLASVTDVLRAITDQETAFVGVDAHLDGAGDWLKALVLGGRSKDAPELGEEAVLLGPDVEGRHAIAVAVRSAGRQWGQLAVATAVPAATRDVVATEQAAIACAVLLSQQDAVAGAARRLESEFVWDLLEGRISDEADAIVRSRQLARELPPVARVLLLAVTLPRPATRRSGAPAGAVTGIEQLRSALARRSAQVLAEHGVHAPTGRRGGILAMIVADRSAPEVRRMALALTELGPELGCELSIGVSAPLHSIGEYPEAARQAGYARAATHPPASVVVVFEDLGAVQFLLEPGDGADLDRYAEQQLGALLSYDRAHGTDLVATLQAYLDCDGHLSRTATKLSIHPKTMSYRLGRIEALTGMAAGRQEDRFNAQLALKILAIRSGGLHPEPP